MTSPADGPARDDDRPDGLLAWQRAGYHRYHRDPRNLRLHVISVPLFWLGLGALIATAFGPWWLAPIGGAAMVIALIAQGRGHKLEAAPPVPFRSPLDFVARFLAEQLITFPRFVASGELRRAHRR